ncbi:CBS domain-containing protein [Paremcibacter congregatus]|uniref:Inosine-5-monophosphate dehydrogenase n=1 Tax=Paremcibacter congregatus TaxID=2043170 RepID=A0A2G4YMH5_9PROT|nr:CBS domain-containing protein [Paremcibacter congregatus]PHZ83493.1 inosine-5-monophosphate dehydrogenase [Paremcibacter congregatus]QDE28041.1 CBS domain-containing protein [Paremcibacter congregatus]|tara:strand:+ start:1068 stop:1499 length:432 start_codon:yes stop_codon:yes gene_type:complete
MYVRNVLQHKGHDIISVAPDNSLQEVAKTLRENKIGAVLVCEKAGRMCGVLSERDIIIAIAKHGGVILEGKVAEFMTEGVYTCSLDDEIKTVMEQMTRRRVRHLPVVEDGNVVGMISIGDVVKQRMAETEAESEALKTYITTA